MSDGLKRRRWSAEMMVGVSAVFIGLCALFVSMYEARLMREETRSEVLPILELSRSYYVSSAEADDWRLLIQAENVGIGPARVVDFRVTVDGQPHATWASAMAALLGSPAIVQYGQSSINGRTIPPDRVVTMFDLSSTELTQSIMAEFERLDFEACYCSVFDECWTTSYQAWGASHPAESCARGDASFTE
ncbi:MAG: hypothetical protein R3288_07125 [Woeseiaceae bacterium]|nr:hypothetical protein [Woeseiaceae bacterium]